ncbi:MAG: hypothetical protein WBV45_10695 [Lutimonas sp.]
MKTFLQTILTLFALVLTTGTINAQEEENIWEPREKMEEVSVRGTVTAVNPETREITLMGKEGGLMTVTAGEEVERFDEIAVDDIIEFDYYTYIKAEFREPTEEEKAEPVQMMVEAGKATEEMAPAGAVGAVVKAVVTIEALNRPLMLATVSGPEGNYVSIPMEDAEFMTKLRIGQVFILTYAEAMAVSLEKVSIED